MAFFGPCRVFSPDVDMLTLGNEELLCWPLPEISLGKIFDFGQRACWSVRRSGWYSRSVIHTIVTLNFVFWIGCARRQKWCKIATSRAPVSRWHSWTFPSSPWPYRKTCLLPCLASGQKIAQSMPSLYSSSYCRDFKEKVLQPRYWDKDWLVITFVSRDIILDVSDNKLDDNCRAQWSTHNPDLNIGWHTAQTFNTLTLFH